MKKDYKQIMVEILEVKTLDKLLDLWEWTDKAIKKAIKNENLQDWKNISEIRDALLTVFEANHYDVYIEILG